MSLGSRIKERREQLGLTRIELATKIGITPSAIANYENGISSPKIELMYKLFDALDCDANYLHQDEIKKITYKNSATPEEFEKLVRPYRDLDPIGRNHVDTVIQWEAERMAGLKQCDNNIVVLAEYEASRAPTHAIPYWESGVSAGNGIYQLNDAASVMITLWATELTKQADFIIKVSGSSMEPDYHDGDKVLVNRKSYVEIGEVGIFVKNGDTYIKEMGNGELISRNPDYPNIVVQDFDNVVCLGKVIGTLTDSMIAKE